MPRLVMFAAVLLWVVLLPSLAAAQASITGIVRDTSGAVLPGVTVEAASPVLIEKVRTAVTDGNGRYQIIDLRPGAYTVTFTLAGFNTVRREGINLTGSATAAVEVELRVGALEETITVTGEAPVVDVSSTTRQAALSADVIDALPTARNYVTLARMIPGTVGGGEDVGGSELQGTGGSVTIHGSREQDQRVTLNGLSTMTLQAGGNLGGQIPDVGSASEVTVDHTGVSAELPTGGVRINFIPRDGGNTFSSSNFFTFSTGAMQGSNFTQALQDAGLQTPNEIDWNFDLTAAGGGPLRRDSVWFWYSFRHNRVNNFVPIFENRNAWNPSAWLYEPDPSTRGRSDGRLLQNSLRITWQATPRNKIAGTYKVDSHCRCPGFVSATRAPETAQDRRFPRLRQSHLEWTSPVTNRLLFEAVGLYLEERWGSMHLQPRGSLEDERLLDVMPLMVPVLEQSTGLNYRMWTEFNNTKIPNFAYRAAMSYVTGTHNFKAGFNRTHGYQHARFYSFSPVSYRFNNGVPNLITLRANPRLTKANMDNDIGFFAQDRWTLDRFTVNLALRYDFLGTSFPEQQMGPGELVPSRNLVIPAQDNTAWHDLTYRTALTYDVRGDGRTALKVTFNKYLRGQTLNLLGGASTNPSNNLVNSTTRSWNDRGGLGINGDFVPQCDLLNPEANGECGRMANVSFGSTRPGATYDSDLLRGYGHRERNWEFAASVQHEVLPRVSVDVGYFRRIWGNFATTDDLALGPEDFDYFSITVPQHPDLPGGGGYTLEGLRNLKPSAFGRPANEFNTLSNKFGKQIEHWNGVDVTVNARLQSGLTLQLGTSTGKTTEDDCEITARLPELNSTGNQRPLQFCHRETPWLTSIKGFGVYTVPLVDVQVSGTFRSSPGTAINANFVANNAYLAANSTLGRPLSGGTANITVALLEPNSMYLDRRNELDFRVGKIVRVGRSRAIFSVDLYNALNSDAQLTVNESFAAWLRPTSILSARLAKVTVQFDF